VASTSGRPYQRNVDILVVTDDASAQAVDGLTAFIEQFPQDSRIAQAHYLRGDLRVAGFTPIGRQESHALYGLSRANALLRVGPGAKLHAGENVAVEVWA